MLSYRRETALQGTLVLAESGRLELPTLTLTVTYTLKKIVYTGCTIVYTMMCT